MANILFVGLTDLLANELARATTFDKFYFESNVQFLPKDVTTLSTIPSVYEPFLDLKEDDDEQYILYIWYKEWSDDFDPNNTKASRNQVWSNTFTICPDKGKSQGRNSYVISLSCKGEDHSEIEMMFHNELNALSSEGKMFYHRGLKHIIKVKMGKLLLCVDRPERTSILQVGDHDVAFSTFWGHSCKVDGYCKKTTYHHAKYVRNTVYTKLFLETNMNLTRQTFCSPVRDLSLLMHNVMSYNHAVEENVHHGMSFILPLHFLHQPTIQSTMINDLVHHILLMERRSTFQFKEHNECCTPFVSMSNGCRLPSFSDTTM